MKVSDQFFTLLTKFEGFVPCPYKDQVGIPTIGIGTTVYPSGKRVAMTDQCINLEQAKAYAQGHIGPIEDLLNHELPGLNQNQFDALVSFIYNIGDGAFRSSTLLRKAKVNKDDPTIKDEFAKWKKAGGKVLNALVIRRKKEAELYFKPV